MKRIIYLFLLLPFFVTAQSNVLNSGQELSPSARAEIKTRNRAFTTGGGTLELQKPTDYIRDISRDLNYDITSDASLIMTPNTIGEGRLFNCKPDALRNILLRSEEFDLLWTRLSINVTADAIANPVNGVVNADKIIEGAANSSHRLQQQFISGAVLNSNITFTCYFKAAERNNVLVNFFGNTDGNKGALLDVSNGTFSSVSSGVSVSSSNEGSGWYKYTFTYFSTNINRVEFFINTSSSYLGDGVSGFYAWGAQLEKAPTATAYQRTTDGITDFQATRATTATVVQKDGSIGESCYNLITNSAQTASVGTGAITSKITNELGPYGTPDATSFTTTAPLRVTFGSNVNYGIPISAGFTYTLSVWLKADVPVTKTLIFRFTSGENTSRSINITTEWVKYSLSLTATTATTVTNNTSITLDDCPTKVYTWGSVIHQGSQPKDYLKTTNRLAVPSISYMLGSDKPAVLTEPQRTNIVFPSDVATTQSRTVTAQPYTLSFYGTGSVTLSGVGSGTLNGTGANNLVSLTFTPTAGSLTATVTGSVTNWQIEAGSFLTSRIVTTSAAATRNDYTSFVDMFNNNILFKDNITLYIEGYTDAVSSTTPWFGFSDAPTISTNNSLYLYNGNSLGWYEGGVQTNPAMTTNSAGTYFKTSIVKNANNLKVFRDGVKVLDTTLAAFDYRYLVLTGGLSRNFVQKIALWKHSKSDVDNILMTTP